MFARREAEGAGRDVHSARGREEKEVKEPDHRGGDSEEEEEEEEDDEEDESGNEDEELDKEADDTTRGLPASSHLTGGVLAEKPASLSLHQPEQQQQDSRQRHHQVSAQQVQRGTFSGALERPPA